jgi:SulP family sulfate permease
VFVRIDELRRFGRVHRTALVLALLALAGVLVLGVLPGLVINATLSLGLVIRHLSRPTVDRLARDPGTGAWGDVDRHAGWRTPDDILVLRISSPVFYASSLYIKEAVLGLVAQAAQPPQIVVLDLSHNSDLDVQSLDTIVELADDLASRGIRLVLAAVRQPVRAVLRRGDALGHVRIEPTLDAATGSGTVAEVT